MPVETQEVVDAQYETDTRSYDLDTIGIEFEYPVAPHDEPVSAGNGLSSFDLRDEVGIREPWEVDDYVEGADVPDGTMTRDHVGAEITSDRLDIHSNDPSLWYAATIERATSMGYPFAETGYGDTIFGMHLHLSEMPSRAAEGLFEMSQENWFRLFVNSSISETSLDPWRHGGVNSATLDGEREFDSRQRLVNDRRGTGHYEWRLPEPVCLDHFIVLMNFVKRLSAHGAEDAREYAHELVHRRDSRLTCVRHYDALCGEYGDEWIEGALREDNKTDPDAAREAYEILSQ